MLQIPVFKMVCRSTHFKPQPKTTTAEGRDWFHVNICSFYLRFFHHPGSPTTIVKRLVSEFHHSFSRGESHHPKGIYHLLKWRQGRLPELKSLQWSDPFDFQFSDQTSCFMLKMFEDSHSGRIVWVGNIFLQIHGVCMCLCRKLLPQTPGQ